MVAGGCGSDDGDKSSESKKTTTTASDGPDGKIRVVYATPSDQVGRDAKQILQLGEPMAWQPISRSPSSCRTTCGSRWSTASSGPTTTPASSRSRSPTGSFGKQLAAVDAFFLIHEFGHAFIDVFDLPVLGKEEDAADAVATTFLTGEVKNGAEYAFDAARFFVALSSRQRKLAPADYFDEHSLDKQRAYSIVCLIAGSSEKAYDDVSRLKILSPGRQRRCPQEYQQKVKATQALLRSHVRM